MHLGKQGAMAGGSGAGTGAGCPSCAWASELSTWVRVGCSCMWPSAVYSTAGAGVVACSGASSRLARVEVAASASVAVTMLDPGAKAPTAALAGASPVYGGITGMMVRGGADSCALGGDSCGASSAVTMAVGFPSSERVQGLLQSRQLGSRWRTPQDPAR